MEVKKYVIDLSLSDRLEELKDSFFDDIALVKYSDHKTVVETMQNKIDDLEKINIKFYNCLESTYKYDLPKIDDLCDIAGVHKFTMLRNELEELLAKGIK